MGLLDLIRGTQISAIPPCAKAIHATDVQNPSAPVAKVAVATSTVAENIVAASVLDVDRYCWPRSQAMNTQEIIQFLSRMEAFCAKGLDEAVAEQLADHLVGRDRDQDDRRVCFECNHLKGYTLLRCDNWKAAGIASTSEGAFVSKDFATLLQRCDGFGS